MKARDLKERYYQKTWDNTRIARNSLSFLLKEDAEFRERALSRYGVTLVDEMDTAAANVLFVLGGDHDFRVVRFPGVKDLIRPRAIQRTSARITITNQIVDLLLLRYNPNPSGKYVLTDRALAETEEFPGVDPENIYGTTHARVRGLAIYHNGGEIFFKNGDLYFKPL